MVLAGGGPSSRSTLCTRAPAGPRRWPPRSGRGRRARPRRRPRRSPSGRLRTQPVRPSRRATSQVNNGTRRPGPARRCDNVSCLRMIRGLATDLGLYWRDMAQSSAAIRRLVLGVPGFAYADLYDPVRLRAFTAAFSTMSPRPTLIWLRRGGRMPLHRTGRALPPRFRCCTCGWRRTSAVSSRASSASNRTPRPWPPRHGRTTACSDSRPTSSGGASCPWSRAG